MELPSFRPRTLPGFGDDPRRVLDTLVMGGLVDRRNTVGSIESGNIRTLSAVTSTAVPPGVKGKLAVAFPLALQRASSNDRCADLFDRMDTNGALLLATTTYLVPSAEQESVCRRGAPAFTYVRTRVTFLCPSFARLTRTEAAMTLIHEALHYGGLGEKPVDPDGLHPWQINQLVRTRCGL